jgi:hypothetical protein
MVRKGMPCQNKKHKGRKDAMSRVIGSGKEEE